MTLHPLVSNTYTTLSFIGTFGGAESPEIEKPPKRLPFKAKTVTFWEVFAKWLKTRLGFLHQTVVIYTPFATPSESRDAKSFHPLSTFLAISPFSGIRNSEMAKNR